MVTFNSLQQTGQMTLEKTCKKQDSFAKSQNRLYYRHLQHTCKKKIHSRSI